MPAPAKKPRPYRPPLHAPYQHYQHYQHATVGVYHLPLTITAEALLLHFRAYGAVEDISFDVQPTTVSAVVRFEREKAARSAARHIVHQIGTHAVLVLRLHTMRLPARPFPGMEPLSSPLREALLREALDTLETLHTQEVLEMMLEGLDLQSLDGGPAAGAVVDTFAPLAKPFSDALPGPACTS